MSNDQDFIAAVNKAKAAADLMKICAEGDENTLVPAATPYPSAHRAVREIQQQIIQQIDPTVDELADVLEQSQQHETNAANSAKTATDAIAQVQTEVDRGSQRLQNEVDGHSNTLQSETNQHSQKLRDQTTYIDGVVEQFGDVDQAITEATAQADRSKAEADKTTAANNEVQAAKSEVLKAKEDATAIVYEGEYSQTPKPGSVAVADTNGHLDIGWTPLLQAMYPYSGVIGSVDKEESLGFNPKKPNLIGLKPRSYNIFGRFVSIENSVSFTLPEAESTAARAIAFDDIFLDWNGEVQAYRSITPHRTTTGYDRDAIAVEHGYSKVQTGLYKTGDTYALLLGRVARRNQGAYHPVFNPEGSGRVNAASLGYATGTNWYKQDALKLSAMAEAFIYVNAATDDTTIGCAVGTGRISTTTEGQPERKAHDAIYADDFTPLYYSAKNVIDRQALLFDSFDRAVAGETFSGAEIFPTHVPVTISISSWGGASIAHTTLDSSSHVRYYGRYFVPKGDANNRIPIKDILDSSGQPVKCWTDGSVIYAWRQDAGIVDGAVVYVPSYAYSARAQFLMVDIIGSLDAMPDEWKTNGIPGNWLAVGEEGESLIPDGTSKKFKVSRKSLECYQCLLSFDNGQTWSDKTSEYKPMIESSNNAITGINMPASRCIMVFYRTSANPFKLTDRGSYTALQERAFLTSIHEYNSGCLLGSNLLNKVPVSNVIDTTAIQNYYYRNSIGLENYSAGLPKHFNFQRINESSVNPCVKALPYLDSSGCMVIAYKELKHNGTSWGDDSKFNIINKQSTVTDLNGETVIVGQKRVELPYHFDGVQY